MLFHLIYQNDIENIKVYKYTSKNLNYLEHYPEIDVEIDTKITPLILACYLGRLDILKLLLESKTIDIDMASEESGHTALSCSIITGNYEILRILLEAGAEVNKPTRFNHTPFVLCLMRLEDQ